MIFCVNWLRKQFMINGAIFFFQTFSFIPKKVLYVKIYAFFFNPLFFFTCLYLFTPASHSNIFFLYSYSYCWFHLKNHVSYIPLFTIFFRVSFQFQIYVTLLFWSRHSISIHIHTLLHHYFSHIHKWHNTST